MQLIAVPRANNNGPCFGCFFYKDRKCTMRDEVKDRNVVCWDKNVNDLIFIIKDEKL